MKNTFLCTVLALLVITVISCGEDTRGTPSPGPGAEPTNTPATTQTATATITASPDPSPTPTSSPTATPTLAPSPTSLPTPGPTTSPVEGELRVGESLQLGSPSTGLLVEFRAVSNDSRCPKDVVCVWAGQATVSLFITLGQNPGSEITVTLDPGTEQAINPGDGHFAIQFLQLLPDPPPAGGVHQQDYRLRLRLSQQASPPPDY